LVAQLWRHMQRKRADQGIALPDFKKGFWTPPLTGEEVLESERKSLNSLGLDAFVSITDHDSINSPLELQKPEAPISLEWTVPYENAFFHIGVHNLPADRAKHITVDLLDYSYAGGAPDNRRLHELLTVLNEIDDVLVVFNHPIWDIEMIGQQHHERAMHQFLAEFRSSLHALEINGFRAWAENEAVIELAETTGLPLVSGGDRHCCQANVMINCTDAASFSEFVSQVRYDRHSRIAILPEYRVPLPSRQLRSIAHVLRTYDHFPEGRRQWTDRVFIGYAHTDELKTLTQLWDGRRPAWTLLLFAALNVLSHPLTEPLISLTVGDTDIGRDDKLIPGSGYGFPNSSVAESGLGAIS
ncbi:MAG TPA: hypothetical protein VJL58_06980, partial [Pyrinomonadaceae bacterium]|nr:hypothetical protein [Pyrinomonadaceae bacterium]